MSHAGTAATIASLPHGRHARQSAQVNARLDADLKEAGDAGLAAAGYTPTQAVRALWTLASQHQADPRTIREALDSEVCAHPHEIAERQRKIQLLHEGVGLVDTFLARHNVRALVPDQAGDATYDELYEQLKEEHFLEKGYL